MADLPVRMVKGGSPMAWDGAKRRAMSATGTWSLQWESGYFSSSFRSTSFTDLMVLSAYPFALLFPTVINRCFIPRA
jgi:hypothetical protein